MKAPKNAPSFASFGPDGIDLWTPVESGDWSTDNSTGRKYAVELMALVERYRAPLLLGDVMEAMSKRGSHGGVEAGFCQQIAEIALGMRVRVNAPEDWGRKAAQDLKNSFVATSPPSADKGEKEEDGKKETRPVLSERDEALRLIRMPEISALLSLSGPAVYGLIRNGSFPPPIKMGRISAWRKSDVLAYLSRLDSPWPFPSQPPG
ncbi:AlpA family phage regulatory protein [Rhizobium sp. S152]|uniref:helix-turn-helix transcriptional regulator n=1 Tax=Rhizobium sp. S152 TaxID=3055038 RepID=UPI0025A971D4|nr:AlpA family phage regulatory protein [Rhizobium sp. S152]MDM9626278.1 AlpA family phage regulatory protein [Rhizobium sp. S152]